MCGKIRGLNRKRRNKMVRIFKTEQELLAKTKADEVIFQAGDEEELEFMLAEYIRKTKCFMYDDMTHMYSVKKRFFFAENVNETDARIEYLKMFSGRCYEKKSAVDISGNPKQVLQEFSDKSIDRTFNIAARINVYNSRDKFYDDIPKWDGVERLDTFLKDAYECNARPQFFKFFLLKTLSMIKDPAHTYCPYWFDWVGEQGVGKTYLSEWLLGGDDRYVKKLELTRMGDDWKYIPYKTGAVLAVDDECKLTLNKNKFKRVSIEEWRSYVSNRSETVRGAYGKEEVRQRTFLVMRTSNKQAISESRGERRQIIFESELPRQGCRLAPTMFYDQQSEKDPLLTEGGKFNKFYAQQILAEGKHLLETEGIYELTEEDIANQYEAQEDHMDITDERYIEYQEFVEQLSAWVKSRNDVRLSRLDVTFVPYDSNLTNKNIKYNLQGLYFFNNATYLRYCNMENIPTQRRLTRTEFWEMAARYCVRGDIPMQIAEVSKLTSTKSNAKMKYVFILREDKQNDKPDF